MYLSKAQKLKLTICQMYFLYNFFFAPSLMMGPRPLAPVERMPTTSHFLHIQQCVFIVADWQTLPTTLSLNRLYYCKAACNQLIGLKHTPRIGTVSFGSFQTHHVKPVWRWHNPPCPQVRENVAAERHCWERRQENIDLYLGGLASAICRALLLHDWQL